MPTRAAGSMSIGGLSTATGVNAETIRYYERTRLLPAPPRSAGGRRLYGPEDVARLAFVRRARALGFSLDEVRRLLQLSEGGGRSCPEARALALAHLAEVRAKIADLKRMEATLAQAAAACGEGADACPVIEALNG